jgi:hypothetical protein
MHALAQAGEAWDYPQPLDNVNPDDMRWLCEEVRHHKYRYDPRSLDWVGLALAKHLGLDRRADRKEAQRHTTGMVYQRCTSSGNPTTGRATSENTWFPEIGTMIPMPPRHSRCARACA